MKKKSEKMYVAQRQRFVSIPWLPIPSQHRDSVHLGGGREPKPVARISRSRRIVEISAASFAARPMKSNRPKRKTQSSSPEAIPQPIGSVSRSLPAEAIRSHAQKVECVSRRKLSHPLTKVCIAIPIGLRHNHHSVAGALQEQPR